MIAMINLAKQQSRVRDKIEAGSVRVLANEKYTLRPEVIELEVGLAGYTGAAYCICCAKRTDALQTALLALGLGSGDEIITTGFVYIATEEAAAEVPSLPV